MEGSLIRIQWEAHKIRDPQAETPPKVSLKWFISNFGILECFTPIFTNIAYTQNYFYCTYIWLVPIFSDVLNSVMNGCYVFSDVFFLYWFITFFDEVPLVYHIFTTSSSPNHWFNLNHFITSNVDIDLNCELQFFHVTFTLTVNLQKPKYSVKFLDISSEIISLMRLHKFLFSAACALLHSIYLLRWPGKLI